MRCRQTNNCKEEEEVPFEPPLPVPHFSLSIFSSALSRVEQEEKFFLPNPSSSVRFSPTLGPPPLFHLSRRVEALFLLPLSLSHTHTHTNKQGLQIHSTHARHGVSGRAGEGGRGGWGRLPHPAGTSGIHRQGTTAAVRRGVRRVCRRTCSRRRRGCRLSDGKRVSGRGGEYPWPQHSCSA